MQHAVSVKCVRSKYRLVVRTVRVTVVLLVTVLALEAWAASEVKEVLWKCTSERAAFFVEIATFEHPANSLLDSPSEDKTHKSIGEWLKTFPHAGMLLQIDHGFWNESDFR